MKYKKINSLDQYTGYCDQLEEMLMSDNQQYKDEIELLEVLIDDYDNRTIEQLGIKEDLNPIETLKYLIEENSLTKAELARQLNVSKQLITEIVNYKRNISKKMVMKLADRFKMMPVAFSRDYELIRIEKRIMVSA